MDYTLGIYQAIGKETASYYGIRIKSPGWHVRIQGISRLPELCGTFREGVQQSSRRDEAGHAEIRKTSGSMDSQQASPGRPCCEQGQPGRGRSSGRSDVPPRRHRYVILVHPSTMQHPQSGFSQHWAARGRRTCMILRIGSPQVCRTPCAPLMVAEMTGTAFLEGDELPDPQTLSEPARELMAVRDRPTE